MKICFKLLFFTFFVLEILGCQDKKKDTINPIFDNDSGKIGTSNSINPFYLPSSTTQIIVAHKYYMLSYNEKHEQAEWVAYQLNKADLSRTNFDRPYFIDDPKVESGSASWKNYKNSGYDKGHLCPAGDRKFSLKLLMKHFSPRTYRHSVMILMQVFGILWSKKPGIGLENMMVFL